MVVLYAIGIVISDQWSGVRARLTMEATSVLKAIADGSFDFAQDDGTGTLGVRWHAFG